MTLGREPKDVDDPTDEKDSRLGDLGDGEDGLGPELVLVRGYWIFKTCSKLSFQTPFTFVRHT